MKYTNYMINKYTNNILLIKYNDEMNSLKKWITFITYMKTLHRLEIIPVFH